jgi:hypothetical protein
MDSYSWERLTLERHREMAKTAEKRARLAAEAPDGTLADRLAVHLRRLADRLDGRTSLTVVSGSR